MKPFIHLFETPKYYYFYDVNSNQSVQVNQKVYEYLKKMLNDELTESGRDLDIEKEIQMLKQDGYLSNNRVKEIKHPDTDMMSTYLNRGLNQLIIQLTHNCNLRCSYCPYTSNDGTYRLHQNNTIEFETIKSAILYLRDRSIDNNDIVISFYGGEPLLEFELIKQTVEFCKEELVGKTINYNLTTNATLFTDEILDFFQKENFRIVVSLDGPKEMNDKNRKFLNNKGSVFDKVIENIEKIEKDYNDLFKTISINMVIDPTQEFSKYELLFKEHPILRDVLVTSTIVEDNYKSKDEKFYPTKRFIDEFQYAEFLVYLDNLCQINLVNDSLLLKDLFMQKQTEYFKGLVRQETLGHSNCPSGPCVPGKMRLMIDVNGAYYPCERISEKIDRNIMGNITNGINVKKARNILNISRENFDLCKDCFAFRHCELCIKSFENNNSVEFSIKDYCDGIRSNFHNQLIGMKIIDEIRNSKEYIYE